MNRKIAVLFSTLLATHLAAADPVAPPPQAAAAGFRELGFDEEFGSQPDIGYGTPGHKWNAGLWWEPVAPASAFRVQVAF